MTNTILFLIIFACLAYAIYDQFLLSRLNGETKLAVSLQRQTIDGWILFGLILLTATQGLAEGLSSLTLFLLAVCITLALYAVLFREPRWLFKTQGFYLNALFIDYKKIRAVNQAEFKNKPVFVIDLTNGKRLFARLKVQEDAEKIIKFLANVGEKT